MATATNVTFLTVALYLLDLAIKVAALGLVPEGRRPSLQPYPYDTEPGEVIGRVVPSGPGFPDENNLRLFNSLIYSAQRRLSITSHTSCLTALCHYHCCTARRCCRAFRG
jgi:phosphatidylserine/phosphatidylglycerophosphate/cardiolipin synthase-like enzyme